MVKFLVEKGASLSDKNSSLAKAAREGQKEMVALLLKSGATADQSSLNNAVFNSTPYSNQRPKADFEETVRLLLDAGALSTASSEEAARVLASAIGTRQGPSNPKVVKILLDAGADPQTSYDAIDLQGNPKKQTPLAYAKELYAFNGGPTPEQKKTLELLEKASASTKAHASQPSEALAKAIEAQDVAQMKQLIAAGADVNGSDKNRNTPLRMALFHGNKEMVRALLDHGADPNHRDPSGWTPIMMASDGEAVDLLISHGADPLAKTDDGRGIFQVSPFDTKPSKIEALIRHGVPFDLQTDGGSTLMQAARSNNVALIDYLTDKGVDPNGLFNVASASHPILVHPLHFASMGEYNRDAVIELLKKGAHPEDGLNTALYNRQMKFVRLYWEHGARNISELTYAVSQHAPPVELQTILDKGVPVDSPKDEMSALSVAAQEGNLEAVQFLVEKGASLAGKEGPPNKGENLFQHVATPLQHAAGEGQREVVAYLLKAGASPDLGALEQAANNSTPYPNQRPKADFEATVRLLLDAGALRDASPEEKAKVLAEAIITRYSPPNPTVVKMLLDAGADPGVPYTITGWKGNAITHTPLAYAQESYAKDGGLSPEQKETLALLEKAAAETKGPAASPTSAAGTQAWFKALRSDDPMEVDRMIAAGAPFDMESDGGLLLLEAANHQNVALIDYLVGKGVDPNAPVRWGNRRSQGPEQIIAMVITDGRGEKAVAALLRHGVRAEDGMEGAVLSRNMKLVRLLWEHGARNISELAYAVSQGAPVAELQAILAKGTPTETPQDVFSPLAIAAQEGNLEQARFLVEHGASPLFHEGAATWTAPLASAARTGQREIVAYLLKAGAPADGPALQAAVGNSGLDEKQRPHRRL
jgi:ankyrin repeat protein